MDISKMRVAECVPREADKESSKILRGMWDKPLDFRLEVIELCLEYLQNEQQYEQMDKGLES